MFKKIVGIVLIVVGSIAAFASLVIDFIGLGTWYGFGPQQIIAIVAGFLVLVGGVVLVLGKAAAKK